MMLATGDLMPSRLKFFVGVNTGYVTDGEPDERYLDFYARRSSAALHCAIVGNVVIPGGFGTTPNTPIISSAKVWTLIARAISDRGSIPGIQLATTWEGYQGIRNFRARDTNQPIRRARELVRNLGINRISAISSCLDDATSKALDAGFRHVQLHAAHGYLFSFLVDDRIYDGADDVLGRVGEWSKRLRSIGIETSIRISIRTGDPRFDADGMERFQDRMTAVPISYIDVSSGFYNIDKQLIYPARPDTLLQRQQETFALASRHPHSQFIWSGRALLGKEVVLPRNVHIGLCRDLIANPDFLIDTGKGCMNCGKCHYFSRGAPDLYCPQWKAKEE